MNFLFPITNFHPFRPFIKNKYQSEISMRHLRVITRVNDDWLNDNYEVPGGHPIIKILNNLNAITDDAYRAFLLIREQTTALAGALGFFNSTDKGRFLEKNWFFMDETIPEVVINVNRPDTQELILQQYMNEDKNYWMSWEPVRVRYHCYTDLDYWIMSKQYDGEKRVACDPDGVNIIEIDMALLYMQYYYWRKSKYSKTVDTEGNAYEYPRALFIARFALNNAIDSQMEVAYLNRVRCYFMGKELGSSRPISKRHAYINTYQNVDNSILYMLTHFKKYGGLNFDKIVSNLPTLSGNYYGDFFKLLDVRLDTRTELITCYSMLPLYEVWISLVKEMQQQKWNKNELMHVTRGLFLMNNRNVYSTVDHKYGPHLQKRFIELEELLKK